MTKSSIKKVYVIRHGQSLANTGAQSMPDKTIPLTDLGQEQAEELLKCWQEQVANGRLPEPCHIYHSQMLRAKQTAQCFSQCYSKITVSELSLLNEFACLGFKTVEGMIGKQRGVLAKQYWQTADIEYKDTPDSDSFSDFMNRVDGFISHAPNLADNSLCFGHGIWIGLLAYRLLGCDIKTNADIQTFRQFQTAMPMYNTVVYRLNICDNGVMHLQVVNILKR